MCIIFYNNQRKALSPPVSFPSQPLSLFSLFFSDRSYKGCGPETTTFVLTATITSFYVPLLIMTVMYILTVRALYKQGKSLQQIAASSPVDNSSLYGLTHDEFSTQVTLASMRHAEHSSYDMRQTDDDEFRITVTLASARQHERYNDYDTKQMKDTDELNATITLTNVRGVEHIVHPGVRDGNEDIGEQTYEQRVGDLHVSRGGKQGSTRHEQAGRLTASMSMPNIKQGWEAEGEATESLLPKVGGATGVREAGVMRDDSWEKQNHVHNHQVNRGTPPDVDGNCSHVTPSMAYLSPTEPTVTRASSSTIGSVSSLASTTSPLATPSDRDRVMPRNRPHRETRSFHATLTPKVSNSKHRRHTRRTSSAAVSGCRSYANSRRAVKVLGILFAVFIVFYLPFFASYVINSTCLRCQSYISADMITIFEWLAYSASMVNPIIYHIFNPDFRRAFYNLLCCKYHKK